MNLKLVKYNDHMIHIGSPYRYEYCYLIQLDEKMIGTIWFEDITDYVAKPKIYIIEPVCWTNGIYREVISQLIDIAFNDLKLQKLCVDVRQTKTRIFRSYIESGFKITKRLPEPRDLDDPYEGAIELTVYNNNSAL